VGTPPSTPPPTDGATPTDGTTGDGTLLFVLAMVVVGAADALTGRFGGRRGTTATRRVR